MQWQLGLLQHWLPCSAPAADVLKGSTAWRLLEALLCFSCQPLELLLAEEELGVPQPPIPAGREEPHRDGKESLAAPLCL